MYGIEESQVVSANKSSRESSTGREKNKDGRERYKPERERERFTDILPPYLSFCFWEILDWLPMGPWNRVFPDAPTNIAERYSFEKGEVGKGYCGTVRICRDLSTGEKFAVKTISKNFLAEVEEREELKREVRALQIMKGTRNIVDLKEVFEDCFSIYLVMELCDRGELFDYILKRRNIPEDECRTLFRQILEAVDHCHSLGWMHRDIKPENILIKGRTAQEIPSPSPSSPVRMKRKVPRRTGGGSQQSSPKSVLLVGNHEEASLGDFKLPGSSFLESSDEEDEVEIEGEREGEGKDTSLLRGSCQEASLGEYELLSGNCSSGNYREASREMSGVVSGEVSGGDLCVKLADFGLALNVGRGRSGSGIAGSPHYMAPEVIFCTDYGTEADMWSLGVVLYAMLSGDLPFVGDDDEAVYRAIESGFVAMEEEEGSLWHTVSDSAKSVVLSLLQMDPGRRPTAGELLEHPWVKAEVGM